MTKIVKLIDKAFVIYLIPQNFLAGVAVGTVQGMIESTKYGFESLDEIFS